MSSNPQTPFPQDNGNSLAEDFLAHPDFRVAAGFAFGWVFWSGVLHTYRSLVFRQFSLFCRRLISRPRRTEAESHDVEAGASPFQEKKPSRRLSGLSFVHRISNDASLVFTLNLSFAFAGFAEFCTLLTFNANGDTACAFAVAWGSMVAQAARLIGLVMLMLEFHRRHGSNVEFYCMCVALVVGLSFILAFTATNTGVVTLVHTLNTALCSREQFAPTALLSSFGFIIMELYVGGRFLGWNQCKIGIRAMLKESANLQVARAGSLLVLDILTTVPNSIPTNQLAQSIPFSLGALIVLAVFNRGVEDHIAIPVVGPMSPLVLPIHSSPTHTPLSVAQTTRRPPSLAIPATVADPPLQSIEVQYPVDDVLVIESPYVPPPDISRIRGPPPMTVPISAPPRIGDAAVFADHQRREILPFQVQYAEQLGRHIHTGPVVAPIRPKPQRPHVQVIIEDMEATARSRNKLASLIGSDIVRLQSASAKTEKRHWSRSTNETPSDYTVSRNSDTVTPSVRTPTTVRDSPPSILTPLRTQSLSSSSRFYGPLSRQHSRKTIRSPAETSAKLPRRSVPRTSFASGRTFGGREELPIVIEGRADGSASGSRRASRMSAAKRAVISRPHSLRPTRPASPQPLRLGTELPAIPSAAHRSPAQHLAVPDPLRSPTPLTPDSPSIRPSSEYIVKTPMLLPTTPPPGSYERALGSGRLRGPRTPPLSSSTVNPRSGWPIAGLVRSDSSVRQQRRRSGSCPELPPLDLGPLTLRTIESRKQQI